MEFIYAPNGSIEAVKVSHPKLARLTSAELLLCYGASSTQTIGENTNLAERAYAKGDASQTYVDTAVNAMVTAGFISSQRGAEIKA